MEARLGVEARLGAVGGGWGRLGAVRRGQGSEEMGVETVRLVGDGWGRLTRMAAGGAEAEEVWVRRGACQVWVRRCG